MSRLLLVDDERAVLGTLQRMLTRRGYECLTASNVLEARKTLDSSANGIELVLCDVNMPGESGIDLVRYISRNHPETAVVMVTGVDDPALADVAIRYGAHGYVIKPFEMNEILISVANALRRRSLELEAREHRAMLERNLLERTSELRAAVQNLKKVEMELRSSHEETVHRLAKAAEFRDNETARHVQRMSRYCALLARRHGLDAARCELIRTASPMHDVGKIGTPDSILLKPGKLTAEEYDIMKRHSVIGYRILKGSGVPLLELAAKIAITHHEKYDGTGYPNGLYGDQIPIEGRIAAVADVFDALTSDRCYRQAMPVPQAVEIMNAGRGSHFDPDLLELFLGAMDEVLRIKHRWRDEAQPFVNPNVSQWQVGKKTVEVRQIAS